MKAEIEDLVKKIVEEEDGEVREQFCELLVGFGQQAMSSILPFIQHKDWKIRYRMIKIIAQIGVESKEGFLTVEEAFFKEEDEDVKRMMMQCLLNAKVTIVTEFSERVKDSKDVKKIPMFTGEEAEGIKDLFAKNKIVFREHVVCYGHPDYPSYREQVIFEVQNTQFKEAIDVLQTDFFGVGSGSGFTGECPACGTEVENVSSCPECELNLEMDPEEVIKYHPFGEFLDSLVNE